MAQLTPRFSTNRTVREYTEQHYLPAAAAYRERARNKGKIGGDIVTWQRTLDRKWTALHFGDVKRETDGAQHAFEVQVNLGDLDPQAVRLELYADGAMGGDPTRQEMQRVGPVAGTAGGFVYRAVSAARPVTDYGLFRERTSAPLSFARSSPHSAVRASSAPAASAASLA
jgi:starch phosphorylase